MPVRRGYSFAGGFACGAIVYLAISLFLEKKGAAVRHPVQFRQYALSRKHEQTKDLIGLFTCVLPTVAGFLFALYLALAASMA